LNYYLGGKVHHTCGPWTWRQSGPLSFGQKKGSTPLR